LDKIVSSRDDFGLFILFYLFFLKPDILSNIFKIFPSLSSTLSLSLWRRDSTVHRSIPLSSVAASSLLWARAGLLLAGSLLLLSSPAGLFLAIPPFTDRSLSALSPLLLCSGLGPVSFSPLLCCLHSSRSLSLSTAPTPVLPEPFSKFIFNC
jgi:hypothetical protein